MVAYSFRKRFIEPIRAGTKAQTIRPFRKRHARPGEALQLYAGMRTKYCQLIGRATCASVWPITIRVDGDEILETEGVYGRKSPFRSIDEFARGDGFADWAEMRAFWREEHPGTDLFDGVLIRWHSFVSPFPAIVPA